MHLRKLILPCLGLVLLSLMIVAVLRPACPYSSPTNGDRLPVSKQHSSNGEKSSHILTSTDTSVGAKSDLRLSQTKAKRDPTEDVNAPTTKHSRNATDGPARSRPLDYEFVVSHYDEGLDWLRPLANHSHVYHKGREKEPPFEVYKWEKLPNEGREGHTYLHHIIHNFDNLANLTVFLQGTGPFHDSCCCYPTPIDFIREATEHNYCKIVFTLKKWGRIPLPGKWQKFLKTGQMRQASCTMGEFYTAVLGTAHPNSIPVCYTGCFSATRDNLRRHPISVYQRAIAFLDGHSNPEEGHYMERLWATVINMKQKSS